MTAPIERSPHASPPRLHNVSVVVRSVGERTTAACHNALVGQVPPEHVTIIREVPFLNAVKRAFEIGIQQNLAWTLCADADVLPHGRAVHAMIEGAQQHDSSLYKFHGLLLDKFFGGARPVGMHLYRTAHLAEALELIDLHQKTLRPETWIMREMAKRGRGWRQLDLVLGLHDYEQYYRDIYRTAFVHAHKHNRQLPYIMALWRRLSNVDRDYQVALWGAQDGLAHAGEVQIDVRQFADSRLQERLLARGWPEKSELEDAPCATPEQVIQTFEAPPEYWLWQQLGTVAGGSLWQRVAALSQHVSWPTIVYWLARGGLRRLGLNT